MSYKIKDRRTGNLFTELLPFSGKLNSNNRWMKLHDLIPWEELENIYKKYFLDLGRPGKDSQLVWAQDVLNYRPREILNFLAIHEIFHELLH